MWCDRPVTPGRIASVAQTRATKCPMSPSTPRPSSPTWPACDVQLSVGRTGQCWDNALAESFFASLKGECLDQEPWPTRARARRAIVEYIGWFNGTRLHSALGYLTPNEYEHEEVIGQVA